MTRIVLWAIAVYVGMCAIALASMLVALGVDALRRRFRDSGQPDPVEQAYADNGFVSVDDLIRATAAADAAEAAFVTPGCRDADAFLAELFPRTKDAPKEQT